MWSIDLDAKQSYSLSFKNAHFVFQTIVLMNIYRNPQNSAQSADGLHCKLSPHSLAGVCGIDHFFTTCTFQTHPLQC